MTVEQLAREDPMADETNVKVTAYFEALVRALDASVPSIQVESVFLQIPAFHRKLLALRGYLRYPKLGRGKISDNWAWSQAQRKEFEKSDRYRRFLSDVGKVKELFVQANPGYWLGGAVKARTLEEQVKLWNGNKSVNDYGIALVDKSTSELAEAEYLEIPDDQTLERFGRFLATAGLVGSPTNATPGLSDHGQADAIDFKVGQGAEVIAGTTARTIKSAWDAAGWTDKLKKAVQDSRAPFEGPLEKPYEPWHYTYLPK